MGRWEEGSLPGMVWHWGRVEQGLRDTCHILYSMVEGGRMPVRYSIAVGCGVEEGGR